MSAPDITPSSFELLPPAYSSDGVSIDCSSTCLKPVRINLHHDSSYVYGLEDFVVGSIGVSPIHMDLRAGRLGVELLLQTPMKDGNIRSESLANHIISPQDSVLKKGNNYSFPFSLVIPYYTSSGGLLPPSMASRRASSVVYTVRLVIFGDDDTPVPIRSRRINIFPKYYENELREALSMNFYSAYAPNTTLNFMTSSNLKNTLKSKTIGRLCMGTNQTPTISAACRTTLPISLILGFYPSEGKNVLIPRISKIKYQVKVVSSHAGIKLVDVLVKKHFSISNGVQWTQTRGDYSTSISVPISLTEETLQTPSFAYKETGANYTITFTLITNYGGNLTLQVPLLVMASSP